jgi:hypothetical protein
MDTFSSRLNGFRMTREEVDGETNRTFILRFNSQSYEIPVDIFIRSSKKAARLVRSGSYRGRIARQVDPETLAAFISACQLKQFRVTVQNAFELLDLAKDWEISSVEAFVGNFIASRNLKREETRDPLGILLGHLAEGMDVAVDIDAVANHMNRYLNDDRLLDLPPEVIFQLILLAEQRDLSPSLVVDFFFKLLSVNPSKAIALCLRMDFGRITDEQRAKIFSSPQMHDMALGYFTATAMSATRDEASRGLGRLEELFEKDMTSLRNYIKKQSIRGLKEVEREYKRSVKQLSDLIENQRGQIEELRRLKSEQDLRMLGEDERFQDQMKILRGVLDERASVIRRRQAIVDHRKQAIAKEIGAQVDTLRHEIQKRLVTIRNGADRRRQHLNAQAEADVQELQRLLANLRQSRELRGQQIDLEARSVGEAQAVLAAKIVHDQVRFDHYLRDVRRRFQVFQGANRLWDLTSDMVKNGEQLVRDIEKRTANACPLNRMAKNSEGRGRFKPSVASDSDFPDK